MVTKKKNFSQPTPVQSAATAFMSIPQTEFSDEEKIKKFPKIKEVRDIPFDKEKFQSLREKEFQEEELDFIEGTWNKIEPKGTQEDNAKENEALTTKATTNFTTNSTTTPTTNPSGKMLWNKSYSESKRNFQYTLSERQQEEFRTAAQNRGYTRNGKAGREPNASKFLQDLIDQRTWEALEFLNETQLWEQFQQWRQAKN